MDKRDVMRLTYFGKERYLALSCIPIRKSNLHGLIDFQTEKRLEYVVLLGLGRYTSYGEVTRLKMVNDVITSPVSDASRAVFRERERAGKGFSERMNSHSPLAFLMGQTLPQRHTSTYFPHLHDRHKHSLYVTLTARFNV